MICGVAGFDIGCAAQAALLAPTCGVTPPQRILFVEDSPISINFGMSLLKKLSHDVILAENGAECLVALEKFTFDLVLMNTQMPL